MTLLDLNENQKKAATHLKGPLLVLAGAGSGKTKVVTSRISFLIENGVLPSDILAVTFTNKAANEMKERVRKLTNRIVLTCTFHSLGARILRESIHKLGYKNDFTIYDSDDSLKLIKNCLKILDIKEEKGLAKELQLKISYLKNNLIPLEELPINGNQKKEKIIFDLYPLYQTKLKQFNALDFDDLLFLPTQLFKEDKETLQFYQNRWLFILIDEYQDTNNAQYILAKMLSSKNKNIFVVGDPDQSIYSWRGAKYQNILNFEKDFLDAQTITLDQNYRSTQNILDAANALICHNENRYEKDLWTNKTEGEKISVKILDTDKLEASFVINEIIKKVKLENISYEDIVIFYRTNSQSRIFEDILLSNKIPYKIYGGLSFYQRKEIKDIIAFLKMIVSNSDFISFSRTINIPKRGLGKASIEKLLKLSLETNTSILNVIKSFLENPSSFPEIRLGQKQKDGLFNYISLIYSLRDLAKKNLPISEIISELIIKSDYLSYLKEDPESFEDRNENLDALLAKANDYEENNENATLSLFLEEISLLTNMEESDKKNSVKLMSIHNGKGLEFPLVFLTGLEEDIFPHINSKHEKEKLEEERRLCYVAMTRAKKKLYLTAALYRYMWGAPKIMLPSRFLKEIPSKFLDNKSEINSFSPYVKKEKSEKPSSFSDENPSCFKVGDRVFHKIFGNGIIKKIFQTSMGDTFDIYFESSHSIKTLVSKYAKLKKL